MSSKHEASSDYYSLPQSLRIQALLMNGKIIARTGCSPTAGLAFAVRTIRCIDDGRAYRKLHNLGGGSAEANIHT